MADSTPAPRDGRNKPLREHLQEAVNSQTVAIAERGLNGIDELKRRAVRKAAKHGITGIDKLADELAHQAKRVLLRGLER